MIFQDSMNTKYFITIYIIKKVNKSMYSTWITKNANRLKNIASRCIILLKFIFQEHTKK